MVKHVEGKGCGSLRATAVEMECSEVHDARKYTTGNNYDKGYSMLKLKRFFINARSLKNNFKMDELTGYALDHNLDIIGVIETWLNNSVFDEK